MIINDLCKNSDSLTDQMSKLRTYYEDINNKISNFITWKDTSNGIKDNLPKIQESYKDILFRDWDIRIKQAEEAIYRERDLTCQITKIARESITDANLITECLGEFLPDTQTLIEYWHNKSKEI